MNGVLEQDNFRFQRLPFPLPANYEECAEQQAVRSSSALQHAASWPVLYILTNSKNHTAYIGETTNYKRRMTQHRDNPEKDFDATLLIDSPTFNQSTTFDFENRLIELFLADETFRVTNKNNGYCAFDYYQRPQYRQQFRLLWNRLQDFGYATHPIGEIENSDLFKYSPFKGLTPDQYEAIESILALIKGNRKTCTFVNGMPGTGKSILAISLLFKLKTDPHYKDLHVALVSPMEQLRKTYRVLARSVDGLRSGDIIGPSEVVTKGPYDVLLVDEAHRMYDEKGAMNVPNYRNTCAALGLNNSATQWDWILKTAKNSIFFFDPKQQVRATGLGAERRDQMMDRLENEGTEVYTMELSTQMRVQGGDEYLDFIYDILTGGPTAAFTAKEFDSLFTSTPVSATARTEQADRGEAPLYELAVVDSFADFEKLQLNKEKEYGLSRMAAGYAWDWISKKDSSAYDIEIEGIRKRWNSASGGNWVNSPNAVHEVGSIHTVQGYDLNYGFIIIGNDLKYDANLDRLVVNRPSFKDRGAKKTATDEMLESIIINAYYVLLTRGMKGTYIYVCDSEVKRYFQRFIPTI
ncbi:DUF2075 domain-containing protein [Collinsella tanakaei]|uniref:DUF2075 domain-containing protein n=1 Tax=Collinsella tanakaei TaxID=626935 RepID=UPI0025A4BE63|nr:DUF2075 domain-containing protein [Collinsella tanakaei]MDM8245590.1 DUF2075 domain-containing protein [Collinsella tanakaei]